MDIAVQTASGSTHGDLSSAGARPGTPEAKKEKRWRTKAKPRIVEPTNRTPQSPIDDARTRGVVPA